MKRETNAQVLGGGRRLLGLEEPWKLVAMDMWEPFMNAARLKAPQADVVHDRFHTVKHLNEAVDTVRKREHAELSAQACDWRTGRKYLFLKSPENWHREEQCCFAELQGRDLKVTKAWGARENFQHIWAFDTREGVRSFFEQCHAQAEATGLEPVRKVAGMLRRHLPRLLNYAIRITNAMTEGFNFKIQVINRQPMASVPLQSLEYRFFFTAENSTFTHYKR